jgi:hypothetical protein
LHASRVVGWSLNPDASGLLPGATDRAIRLVGRFAACSRDARQPEFREHNVATLVGQPIFTFALGYEGLNDHDEFRSDALRPLAPSPPRRSPKS